MKKYMITIALCICAALAYAGQIADDCTYNGIPLYGRVQVVDFMADFTVQKVSFLPDLRVKDTPSFPSQCGEWQFVEFMPDFTIQYVDFLPDFTIQMVDFAPGLP